MCWQTKNKNMSRISVRHCSKLYRSKLKNVQTTRKIIIFEIFSEDSNRLLQTIEETSKRHQVYSQPLDDINAWHAHTHPCTQYERERERVMTVEEKCDSTH